MLEQALHRFFLRHPDISNQKKLAVAVSGGPDSMALSSAMHEWAKSHDKSVYLISVDHGLRKAAAEELRRVSVWAKEQMLTHEILRWEGEKPDTAVMEEARNARYRLMADYCDRQDISTLFIAHHQDDQAETFLIRLSKGSGLNGLGAMQECRAYNQKLLLARPFLSIEKTALINYCQEKNIPFVEDPSNLNDVYLRPRLRASIEILEKEGLTSKRLSITAARLSRAREALETFSLNAYQSSLLEQGDNKIVVDFNQLKQQPEEIGLRVLQHMIETLRPVSDYSVRMEKLEELFLSLWHDATAFKPRTLGKCKISLKNDKSTQNQALWVEKEV